IENEEDEVGYEKSESSARHINPSGPKARDPYELDDTSVMLPIFVAVGAFIPLVLCMCKL
ncbi:KIAA0152 -like protein, partial [Caligus rogercresseyi]